MPIVAMGLVLSQDIIFAVIDEQYSYVTRFCPFLILVPLCYTAGETTGIGIALCMKTGYKVFIYTVSALVNCVVCLLLIPKLGANGGAIAAGVGAVTALIMKTWIGQRLYSSMESLWPMVINISWFSGIALLNMLLPHKRVLLYLFVALYCVLPHNLAIVRMLFGSGGYLRFWRIKQR